MAFLISEEKLVEDSVSLLDQRLNSPIARFIEQTPTFVTYYHININESTNDAGFNDVESFIGESSPLRFQKIEKFPIYGLEAILAQWQDTDLGIDGSYEGEAVILPNTIKPLPNDYFIIKYVGDNVIFRITEIVNDNIRTDNFYKIMFKLDSIDDGRRDSLNKQVYDNYTCILENIGSENKCIIQSDFKEQLDKIDKLYNDMTSLYMSIFYSERYNALLGEMPGGFSLYDPYMSNFINKHELLKKKNVITTTFLEENHIIDNKKSLKYERSIYRFFERRDVSLIKPFYYTTINGFNRKESGFYRWSDENVYIVDIPSDIGMSNPYRIFPDMTINTIKLNGPTESKYLKLIKKFIRNDSISIYDIDLTLNEELINLDANLEMFFITPLLLYIIKEVVVEFNKTGIAEDKHEEEPVEEILP